MILGWIVEFLFFGKILRLYGVSIHGESPIAGWFFRKNVENPNLKQSKMDDLGVPLFRKPPYGSVSKPCTPGEHQNSW